MWRPTGAPTFTASRISRGTGPAHPAPVDRDPPGRPGHEGGLEPGGDRGGDARARPRRAAGWRAALPAHGGQARAAEDEQQVEEQVHDVRHHRREDDGARRVRPLEVGARGEEEEEGGQAGQPGQEVAGGLRRHLRRDPQRPERERHEAERDGEERADEQGEPGPLPEEVAGARPVAGAERLRDERVEPHHRAHPQHRDGEEEQRPEPDPGQLHRPGPPHHRGVHHAHERLPGVGEGQRHGEPDEGAHLGAGGRESITGART